MLMDLIESGRMGKPQTADSVLQPVYVTSGETQAPLPGEKRTPSEEEPEEVPAQEEKAPEEPSLARRMLAAEQQRIEQTLRTTDAEQLTSIQERKLGYQYPDQPSPETGWDEATEGADARLWEYVGELPPLKRAIILSEILGSPKALDAGSHTQPSWRSSWLSRSRAWSCSASRRRESWVGLPTSTALGSRS